MHFSFVVKRENVSNFYFFFPFSLSLDQRTLFFQISSSMLRPLLEISKSTYPSYVSLYQFSQARADFSTLFQSNNRVNIFIEQRKRYTRIFHFKPESLSIFTRKNKSFLFSSLSIPLSQSSIQTINTWIFEDSKIAILTHKSTYDKR